MNQTAQELPLIKAQSPAATSLRNSAEIVKLRDHVVSEFQSDAIELEEREPPRIAYLSLYLVTALIVACIVWACLSQVDKIVVARGKLTTTQPNIVVQALETSVIRTVHAAAGDVVKKGQALARLDPTFTQSDADQLQAKVDGLDAKIRRLEAELGNREFDLRSLEANPSADEQLEARLFKQRKAFYSSHVEALDQQIQRDEANVRTNLAQQAVLKQRLEGTPGD